MARQLYTLGDRTFEVVFTTCVFNLCNTFRNLVWCKLVHFQRWSRKRVPVNGFWIDVRSDEGFSVMCKVNGDVLWVCNERMMSENYSERFFQLITK